jgi:hypothetical protein
LFPADGNVLERTANFFWGWHIRMRSAVTVPVDSVFAARLGESVRLWQWAVPGLPILAFAGWWLGRQSKAVLLLGLSFMTTMAGYLFVTYSQGHGWGARYLHPAWGALPILSAVCLLRSADAPRARDLPRYVAFLAILSLIFATALRAAQIHGYIEEHLANTPEILPTGRQVVLVRSHHEHYTADLVQNDPFLRGDVWYLLSIDRTADANLMKRRFPGARLVREDYRGEVWLLPIRERGRAD